MVCVNLRKISENSPGKSPEHLRQNLAERARVGGEAIGVSDLSSVETWRAQGPSVGVGACPDLPEEARRCGVVAILVEIF